MQSKIFNEVLSLVSAESDIPTYIITSKCRLAEVVDARQLVVWFCSTSGLYPRAIAELLGISRQAVQQKLQTVESRRKQHPFKYLFERIERKLQERRK